MTSADPLAQLRDIHLPDPISAWPPGPGWWLLGIALLLSVMATVIWWSRQYRANAWRRQARAALNNAYRQWRNDGLDAVYLQTVNETLKRAALQQFPREAVARLSGARWESFLDAQWQQGDTSFSELGFAGRAYQPSPESVDIDLLHRLGRKWVSRVRGEPC